MQLEKARDIEKSMIEDDMERYKKRQEFDQKKREYLKGIVESEKQRSFELKKAQSLERNSEKEKFNSLIDQNGKNAFFRDVNYKKVILNFFF